MRNRFSDCKCGQSRRAAGGEMARKFLAVIRGHCGRRGIQDEAQRAGQERGRSRLFVRCLHARPAPFLRGRNARAAFGAQGVLLLFPGADRFLVDGEGIPGGTEPLQLFVDGRNEPVQGHCIGSSIVPPAHEHSLTVRGCIQQLVQEPEPATPSLGSNMHSCS